MANQVEMIFLSMKNVINISRESREFKKGQNTGVHYPISSLSAMAGPITFVEYFFSFLDQCLRSYILNLIVCRWPVLSRP